MTGPEYLCLYDGGVAVFAAEVAAPAELLSQRGCLEVLHRKAVEPRGRLAEFDAPGGQVLQVVAVGVGEHRVGQPGDLPAGFLDREPRAEGGRLGVGELLDAPLLGCGPWLPGSAAGRSLARRSGRRRSWQAGLFRDGCDEISRPPVCHGVTHP